MKQKNCLECGNSFSVTDEDLEFYKKMEAQEPLLCPVDRSRRRLMFRNLRKLYKIKCAGSGEMTFSNYGADTPFPVYSADYWWSDKWDGRQLAQDYDLGRPFMEQFIELYNKAPKISRPVLNVEDCDFCSGIGNSKHCYLAFNVDYCEDCYYLTDARKSKSCVDCLGIVGCELCFQSIRCENCYDLSYSLRCENCRESMFLSDCHNCTNCIGCCNLRNATYQIFNKPVSKDEFEAKKKELQDYNNLAKFQQEFYAFSLNYPKKYYYGTSNEDFSGDDIRQAKNSYNCFYADNIQDCKYSIFLFDAKNCQDIDVYGDQSEWLFNCTATGDHCSHNICCMHCWSGSTRNAYGDHIVGCQDTVGCCSLKKAQYCILNKQYSSGDYADLRKKIEEQIRSEGKWGEFFSGKISAHAYNHTFAHEYYPLTQNEIADRGYRYFPPDDNIPKVEKIIDDANTLPTNIDDTTVDILKWAIKCQESGRPFMIQPGELAFYMEKKIPISRLHPDVRHEIRMKQRNPYMLFNRQCDCSESNHDHNDTRCPNNFSSSFSLEKKEKVCCEGCYRKSVI